MCGKDSYLMTHDNTFAAKLLKQPVPNFYGIPGNKKWIYIFVLEIGCWEGVTCCWLTSKQVLHLSVFSSPLIETFRNFLKWADPGLFFVYFCSFQTQFVQKNCRRQQDSISYRRSRRRARWPLYHHHGPLLTSRKLFHIPMLSAYLRLVISSELKNIS